MSTHIVLILDKSGSMDNIKKSTIESYNEIVQQVQHDAKEKNLFVSLITFNGHVYKHFWRERAEELSLASGEEYTPNGMTALQDAIGYVGNRLTKENDDQVIVNVISDGQENASNEYSHSAIKEILNSDMEFNYIGCEADWFEDSYGEIDNTISANMSSGAQFMGAVRSMTQNITKSYGGNYIKKDSKTTVTNKVDIDIDNSTGAKDLTEEVFSEYERVI